MIKNVVDFIWRYDLFLCVITVKWKPFENFSLMFCQNFEEILWRLNWKGESPCLHCTRVCTSRLSFVSTMNFEICVDIGPGTDNINLLKFDLVSGIGPLHSWNRQKLYGFPNLSAFLLYWYLFANIKSFFNGFCELGGKVQFLMLAVLC